jgi:hypothetical protein
MALAQAPAETAGNAAQAFEAASFGAVAQAATMEIATPEADTAQSSWMPPPPDAHFGSDPHDALAHAAQAAEPAVGDMSATEPAAEAVADAEGLSAHPGEEPLPVEHEAQAASAEGQTGEFETGPVPDHAQNAEFPAPPLDPTGVIAGAMQAQASQTQSGFHTPG